VLDGKLGNLGIMLKINVKNRCLKHCHIPFILDVIENLN
jgi:hypothetical protein